MLQRSFAESSGNDWVTSGCAVGPYTAQWPMQQWATPKDTILEIRARNRRMATSRASGMRLGSGSVTRDPQTFAAWPNLSCVALHVTLVPHNLIGRSRHFRSLGDFIIAHCRYPL